MKMERPMAQFIDIDLNSNIIIASPPPCANCANTDGGYRGGGQACYGDDSVSTECDDPDALDIG